MKVAFGICSGEIARYSLYYDSLCHIDGFSGQNVLQERGADIGDNVNAIVERALKANYDYLFLADDDQIFVPHTLSQLLSHDKDIVGGLYVRREPPWIPHVYDREDKNGYVYPHVLKPNESGLLKVMAIGTGCSLINMRVFRKLKPPYWPKGSNGLGNDLYFCKRARQAGFEVWVDLELLVGHIMPVVVWPVRNDKGEWKTVAVHGETKIAVWDAAKDGEICFQPPK